MILRQVANSVNGKVDNVLVTLPDTTTWGSAVEMSMSAMKVKSEHRLLLFHPKPRAVKDELRKSAREYVAEPNTLPLKIRNAQNAEQLPTPKKPSMAVKRILKQNAKITQPGRNPFTTSKVGVDDRYLACVSGKLILSGLDAEDDGQIIWPKCL